MNTIDQEIVALKTQLNEWSLQISLCAVKHQTAAEVALKFAQELSALRAKQHDAALKLRDFELHQSGMYMWENIGGGG